MIDGAVGMAEEMTTEIGRDPWGWFAQAGIQLSSRHKRQYALSASGKLTELLPNHPDAVWMRAEALVWTGNEKEAIAFLESYSWPDGERARLLVTKAKAHEGLSRQRGLDPDERKASRNQALQVLHEARQVDPGHVGALFLAGSYLSRNNRAEEGIPLLKRAVDLSPNSNSVNSELWHQLHSFKSLSEAERKAQVIERMKEFLSRRSEYPTALLAVAAIANRLGFEGLRSEVEERILSDFPNSRGADVVLRNRYRDFQQKLRKENFKNRENVEHFRQMLWDYVKRPYHSGTNFLGGAYLQLFLWRNRLEVAPEELLQVVDGMVQYEEMNPRLTYAESAIALAERTSYYRRAEEIARKGVEAGLAKVERGRFRHETEGRFQLAKDRMKALMVDALGWVYFNEGRFEEAERKLLAAYELNHRNMLILHHLGRLYEAKANLSKAEEFYVKGLIIQTPRKNPSEEAIKRLYSKMTGSLEGFDRYRTSLDQQDRKRRKGKILSSRLLEPERVFNFSLKTLEGEVVSLDTLEDRIVVINFWGIWCGWCVKEMPEFQALHERYLDDPKVEILTINYNDRDPAEVAQWMEKNNFSFRVLFDDGYVSNSDIHAFPTTWFLDTTGKKAFEKNGWSEKLLEEFSWRIEEVK